jgi:hypothetical protein
MMIKLKIIILVIYFKKMIKIVDNLIKFLKVSLKILINKFFNKIMF